MRENWMQKAWISISSGSTSGSRCRTSAIKNTHTSRTRLAAVLASCNIGTAIGGSKGTMLDAPEPFAILTACELR